jgi:hypothetical protein
MPSSSEKQRRFFQAVKGAKQNPNAPAHLRKVANSMTDTDIDAFASSVAEGKDLQLKKTVLSILKDIQEPMYLQEDDTETNINPIAKTIPSIKRNFEQYVAEHLGHPLGTKEKEALNTFQDTKPTKVSREEIRYETTDEFQQSTTTVIKKMRSGTDFVFTAFIKHSKPETPDEKEAPPEAGAETGPTPTAKEAGVDEIIVTNSIPFKDEIKGGSILAEFLKKLDL